MLALLIIFASLAVFLIILYKHTDELTYLTDWYKELSHAKSQLSEANYEINKDLDNMVEALHDNLKALSTEFGELKKLFLLGKTSLDIKEIIRHKPERIFDANAFVQKFLHRAKKLVEKKEAEKKEKKKFKSLYSKSITEPDHSRGELLAEQH